MGVVLLGQFRRVPGILQLKGAYRQTGNLQKVLPQPLHRKAYSLRIGEGEAAHLGAVAAFLALGVGGQAVLNGGLIPAQGGAGIPVAVVFFRAPAEVREVFQVPIQGKTQAELRQQGLAGDAVILGADQDFPLLLTV